MNNFIVILQCSVLVKCNDYEKCKQIFMNSNNKTTAMFNNILKD